MFSGLMTSECCLHLGSCFILNVTFIMHHSSYSSLQDHSPDRQPQFSCVDRLGIIAWHDKSLLGCWQGNASNGGGVVSNDGAIALIVPVSCCHSS